VFYRLPYQAAGLAQRVTMVTSGSRQVPGAGSAKMKVLVTAV
jgi:hypothetical protein